MAPRNRTRTKNKRRPRRRGVIRKRLPRSLVPYKKVVTMRVADRQQLTSTAGALSKSTISMNDITDPFKTAGTGQPLYYDQAATLYRTAIVLGCKISVQSHNTSANAIIYGITPVPYDMSAVPDSYEYYQEINGTRSRILSSDVDHGFMSMKRNLKRHFHVKDMIDSNRFDIDLENQGHPNKEAVWHLWQQPMDQTATTVGEYAVQVEFIVLLRDPFIPSRSTDV